MPPRADASGSETGPESDLVIIKSALRDSYRMSIKTGDVTGATDVARELLHEGRSHASILTDLVAATQVEIGEAWARGELSVADEHAATAIAESVVVALAQGRPTDQILDRAAARRVVVLCAEDEWHSLAARIVSELIRIAGHDVRFLGASVPSAELGRYLERHPVDVLAISASTVLAIPGLFAQIVVASGSGVPVIAGGAALGDDPSRARILGANAWANDLDSLVRLIAQCHTLPPGQSDADIGGALAISARHPWIVAEVLSSLGPDPSAGSGVDAVTVVDHAVGAAEAAVLLRDPMVFAEFVTWYRGHLETRGRGVALVDRVVERVAPFVDGLDYRAWSNGSGDGTEP